jgi:ATP-binding cassette subfamily F protein uup
LPQEKPVAAKAPRPPAPRRAATPRKRLSPTEQHALKTAPGRIEALHDDVRRLEALLADASFYARDREGFAKAGAELAKIQQDLAAAEEEWLRLELLREEVQGA